MTTREVASTGRSRHPLPEKRDPTDTDHPDHLGMSWTACYDDSCMGHLSDKQGSGYWPKRKQRTLRVQATQREAMESFYTSTEPEYQPTSPDREYSPEEYEASEASTQLMESSRETLLQAAEDLIKEHKKGRLPGFYANITYGNDGTPGDYAPVHAMGEMTRLARECHDNGDCTWENVQTIPQQERDHLMAHLSEHFDTLQGTIDEQAITISTLEKHKEALEEDLYKTGTLCVQFESKLKDQDDIVESLELDMGQLQAVVTSLEQQRGVKDAENRKLEDCINVLKDELGYLAVKFSNLKHKKLPQKNQDTQTEDTEFAKQRSPATKEIVETLEKEIRDVHQELGLLRNETVERQRTEGILEDVVYATLTVPEGTIDTVDKGILTPSGQYLSGRFMDQWNELQKEIRATDPIQHPEQALHEDQLAVLLPPKNE